MRVSWIEALLRRRGPGWLAEAAPLLVQLATDGFPLALGAWIGFQVFVAFAGRMAYPYDLEWMEGGMLAHAWRVQQWYPLYVEPNRDWIPYLYPPGYPALLAGLSTVFGLSAGLGRAVSIAGTLGTCAALIFGCWRYGRSVGAGVLAAMVFLSLYPDTGAFYDLIRPDALGTGLLAWSVVLGMDERRRVRVLSGLLLATAFAVKHNLAAYGLPMAVGIAARFGWVEAAWFVGASAGPAVALVGVLQGVSQGHFLTTLLGIARSHPMVVGRFLPGAIEELGKHVSTAVLGASVALTAGTVWLSRGRVRWGVALCALVGAAWVYSVGMAIPAAPRMPQPLPMVEGAAWVSIGLALGAVFGAALGWPRGRARAAVPVAGLLGLGLGASYGLDAGLLGGLVLGSAGGLAAAAVQGRVDGRWLYGVGIAAMALFTAGMMRAHHGGFLNVYIPMHFAVALALGLGVAQSRRLWPRVEVYALGAAVVAVQLYAKSGFEPERYLPTAADVAAGDRFVEALRECEGPVLSPYNPWLPVLAGHAPSFHLIALWDIDHKSGPYHSSMADIRAAADEHYWACVVAGNGRPLGFGIQKNYGVWKTPRVTGGPRSGGGPPTFMPRTGWRVRPQSILGPAE